MKLVKIAVGVLALGALVLTPLNSEAQLSRKPKVLLHLKPITTKNQCVVPAGLGGLCTNAVNTGDLVPTVAGYHMQLIVDLGDDLAALVGSGPEYGIAGLQFGVDYPGQYNETGTGSMINVFGWTLCATLEFITGNFPAPQGSNLLTWDPVNSCQMSRLSCAGYFYMAAYSAGTFRILPRPVDGIAKIANCGSVETILGTAELGSAQFSAGGVASAMACNPCAMNCDGVAVQPATWSAIKRLNSQ